jgi:hypothetical protein
MPGELANRVIDPVILVSTLVMFFALWRLVPRLGAVGSTLLASLISAIAFTTVVEAMVPRLPSTADTFFAVLISALIQCGFAILAVRVWQYWRT